MEPEDKQTTKPAAVKSKSYGKRPVWQWVVIYLVAAVIVYGLIYLAFFRHSGKAGGYGGY